MNKTHAVSSKDIKPSWHFIDARGKVLGSVASEISSILIGKHRPDYSPNLNLMDKVVVTNAGKIAVTGNKKSDKIYYRHTGYPGALKSETLGDLMDRKPTEALRRAVFGMLPKNKLRKQKMVNLYIYPGSEHPHKAQESLAKKEKNA